MLYRLMHYAPSVGGWFLGFGAKGRPDGTQLADRVVLAQRFVDASPTVFAITRTPGEVHMIFDAKYKPSLRRLAIELVNDATEQGSAERPYSDYELLATVIALGDVLGSYGSSYWSQTNDIVHLLACGIDWSKFRDVSDDTWSVWAGTFAEPDNTPVIGTALHCRCGDVYGLQFGLQPPSLTQLFRALGDGGLQKIYEV
jgi:hypothetical protein